MPQDTPDDCVPLSDQAAVEHEAEQWALLWKEKAEYVQPQFDINEDMLHQMLPEAIRTAVATFPAGTGLGHDHISPRAFLRLSDSAIGSLATLFMAFERRGSWADVLDLVLIVLQPKTYVGFRPIGLFPRS